MFRRRKSLFFAAGLAFLSITVILGTMLYMRYGPQTFSKQGYITPAAPGLFTPQAETTLPLTPVEGSALPAEALQAEMTGPGLADTPWMSYNSLDLQRQKITFSIRMACQPHDTIALQDVLVIPWHADVLHNGEFSIQENTAVAWEHFGYYGLWMHSGVSAGGTPLTAFPLQVYLELDDAGGLRSAQAFNTALAECLVDSEVRIAGQGKVTLNRVSAAVRVPASGVDAVSQQTMTLVPYLAETYPDSGFTNLNAPALVLYFCGRGLSDELYDPNADYFTQSRIIVAITPVE